MECTVTRDDWYRNNTWDAEIEASFEQRLRRARDKSQYLRIQASYLAERYPSLALGLLERYFALGEHFDIAQAHVVRGRALMALGNVEGALSSYEAALEGEHQYPFLRTQAYLDYACLVVEAGPEELYARALEVLDTHQDRRIEEARAEATLAMKAAQETTSGFRYHQSVGLVRDTQDAFAERVAELAF
jgi:tetratricopeptide (TPR) repeat protein